MISAIVLAPDALRRHELAAEIVARSLPWLVSAVVVGVVRDLTLAAPPALELAGLADHVGCDLVEAEDEAKRFRDSVRNARCRQLLVLTAGHQPTGPLAEELDAQIRSSVMRTGLLLAVPAGPLQRLMPGRAPVVGILAAKDQALAAGSFERLARACRRGPRFETRAKPLV